VAVRRGTSRPDAACDYDAIAGVVSPNRKLPVGKTEEQLRNGEGGTEGVFSVRANARARTLNRSRVGEDFADAKTIDLGSIFWGHMRET